MLAASRSNWLLVGLLAACGAEVPVVPVPVVPVVPVPVVPVVEPVAVVPVPVVEPVVVAEPVPVAEPVVSFDAATVMTVRATIVAIANRKDWVPCGGQHSVGGLEVEVLEVGEPAPRMNLLVSCPVDRRRGPMLVVGATLVFTLHARKQTWPGVRGLNGELPRRYVAAIAEPAAG